MRARVCFCYFYLEAPVALCNAHIWNQILVEGVPEWSRPLADDDFVRFQQTQCFSAHNDWTEDHFSVLYDDCFRRKRVEDRIRTRGTTAYSDTAIAHRQHAVVLGIEPAVIVDPIRCVSIVKLQDLQVHVASG